MPVSFFADEILWTLNFPFNRTNEGFIFSALIKSETDNLPLFGQRIEHLFYEDELCGLKTARVQFTRLERRLAKMIWQGDISRLISLEKQAPDYSQDSPCSEEDKNCTSQPLLQASQAGDELLVDVLLKQNVDANDTNEDGNTPLHCYFMGDTGSHSTRILFCLLEHDAKVFVHNKLGITPLHLAAMKDNYIALEVLLLHSPEHVDILSVANETPLFLSVKKNSINCAKLLLQFGASREALNLRGQRPIDFALTEEMRNLLRTSYPRTLGCNKLSKGGGASHSFGEVNTEGMLKSFLEWKTSNLSKSTDFNKANEKIEICRYFHSPIGCGRGSKCHYSHDKTAQKLEKSELQQFKHRVLSYNKDPASLQDDLSRTIYVSGVPLAVDSVDLKNFFEEEFGPVENAIVIGNNSNHRVQSKGSGILTFKHEDSKKIALKTHFITLYGCEVEVTSVVPKCHILMETNSSLSDHKTSSDLDEDDDSASSFGGSDEQRVSKSSEFPSWLTTFKKWLPAYLEKACKRLEGTWYPLSSLKGDFRATCGMELDYESLGFVKLSDFLRSLPGLCRMHVISSGNGSPTHMVLQPFGLSTCKPHHLKHVSSPALLSSSFKDLSSTHSKSLPELLDSTPSSNESILQESNSVKKAGFFDVNPNSLTWEHKPYWCLKPGRGGVGFLNYNLWESGVSEEGTATKEKTQQPFSFFVHQWDSGLQARGYCFVCKKSAGTILICGYPKRICQSCKKNLCSSFVGHGYIDGIQLLKPAGFNEEFPSLEELGLSSHYGPSSISHRNKGECENANGRPWSFLV